MKIHQILTSNDESSPRPWVEVEVSDGSPRVIVTKINGLMAFKEAEATASGEVLTDVERNAMLRKAPSEESPKVISSLTDEVRPPDEEPLDPDRPNLTDEVHVLAVTLNGDVELVPMSRQREFYYAHLGWYDPKTLEWELIQFVPDATLNTP